MERQLLGRAAFRRVQVPQQELRQEILDPFIAGGRIIEFRRLSHVEHHAREQQLVIFYRQRAARLKGEQQCRRVLGQLHASRRDDTIDHHVDLRRRGDIVVDQLRPFLAAIGQIVAQPRRVEHTRIDDKALILARILLLARYAATQIVVELGQVVAAQLVRRRFRDVRPRPGGFGGERRARGATVDDRRLLVRPERPDDVDLHAPRPRALHVR